MPEALTATTNFKEHEWWLSEKWSGAFYLVYLPFLFFLLDVYLVYSKTISSTFENNVTDGDFLWSQRFSLKRRRSVCITNFSLFFFFFFFTITAKGIHIYYHAWHQITIHKTMHWGMLLRTFIRTFKLASLRKSTSIKETILSNMGQKACVDVPQRHVCNVPLLPRPSRLLCSFTCQDSCNTLIHECLKTTHRKSYISVKLLIKQKNFF